VYISFDGIIQRLCNHHKSVFCNCLTSGEKQVPFFIRRNYDQCPPTEQKHEDIRVRMKISPRQSSRQLAQECNILKSSVLRGLKALTFHPYKVSLAQKLNSADPVARITFVTGCCDLSMMELSIQRFYS
jgi:hypothetical protein